jgi:hypothetical protein
MPLNAVETSRTSEGAAAWLAVQLAHDAGLGVLALAHHLACLVALLAHISHGGQGLASDGVLGGLGVGEIRHQQQQQQHMRQQGIFERVQCA